MRPTPSRTRAQQQDARSPVHPQPVTLTFELLSKSPSSRPHEEHRKSRSKAVQGQQQGSIRHSSLVGGVRQNRCKHRRAARGNHKRQKKSASKCAGNLKSISAEGRNFRKG
jgi:hypothetical protein